MYIKVDMNIVNFVMRKRSCLAVLVLAIVHWTAHSQSFDVKVQEFIPHPKGNSPFRILPSLMEPVDQSKPVKLF